MSVSIAAAKCKMRRPSPCASGVIDALLDTCGPSLSTGARDFPWCSSMPLAKAASTKIRSRSARTATTSASLDFVSFSTLRKPYLVVPQQHGAQRWKTEGSWPL